MSDELMFRMGQYEARFPVDRAYSRHHLWLQPTRIAAGRVYRVGFTAYSVRLLQDVYFLEWTVEPGTEVKERQEIGEIESSKALSSIYAPAAGRLVRFNAQVLDDPSLINVDNYGRGWLFELETGQKLLSAAQYVELLEQVWPRTQQLLKGQAGYPMRDDAS